MKNKITLLLTSLFLLISSVAFGGGPFFVDTLRFSGEPARWPYDAATKEWVVRYKVDQEMKNVKIAVDEAGTQKTMQDVIADLFQKWAKGEMVDPSAAKKGEGDQFISTVALRMEFQGDVGEDITKDNYGKYIKMSITSDEIPQTVIIFDKDGSIIEAMCKVEVSELTNDEEEITRTCNARKNGLAGLAAPHHLDGTTKVIRNGFAVLNGRMIDGQPNTSENVEMGPKQFLAVALHEFGHLLNLGHSQINLKETQDCGDNFECEQGRYIATMFPASKASAQFTLHRDDVIGLTYLYPKVADDGMPIIQKEFCTFIVNVVDEEGKGVQGINIVVRGVDNPLLDARSMITGANLPGPKVDGKDRPNDVDGLGLAYLFGGYPGETYEIIYEPLTHEYDKGGGFPPLGTESPADFESGSIPGSDGKETVTCNQAGEMIRLPDFNFTKALASLASDTTTDNSAPKAKKGWFCQLNPNSSLSVGDGLGYFLIILFALGLLSLRNKRT